MAQQHVVIPTYTFWDPAVEFHGNGNMYPVIAQANYLTNLSATDFDPLTAGIKFDPKVSKVSSHWTEALPDDQVVGTAYARDRDGR
jgi:hypothetical protein